VSPARWPLLFVIGGLVPLALSLALWRLLQESAEWTALRMSPQITVGNPSQIGSFRHTVTHGRALSSVLLWISFFLALVVLYLLLNWLPTLLKDNGMSSRQAASAQILFNVGGALAALSMGRLLTGRWRLVALLSVSVAVPVTLYALSQIGHAFLAAAIVVLLLGMSMLALQAYLYSTAPASYPTWLRGVGVGTALAMGRLGSIAGPKLGGWLKELGHGPSQLLLELVPIAIVGSVIALMLALIQRRIPTATN
jgi:MFS transporter, AAHS family, 3-hydroxyphenylpropionic acid transporter